MCIASAKIRDLDGLEALLSFIKGVRLSEQDGADVSKCLAAVTVRLGSPCSVTSPWKPGIVVCNHLLAFDTLVALQEQNPSAEPIIDMLELVKPLVELLELETDNPATAQALSALSSLSFKRDSYKLAIARLGAIPAIIRHLQVRPEPLSGAPNIRTCALLHACCCDAESLTMMNAITSRLSPTHNPFSWPLGGLIERNLGVFRG